ncbi:hypothetical protein OSB04_008634 [Centaurea solstitialis]|uniref:ent-kaurene synthase n=1 Tax=Centaurea solstitialis TaxID=347529 RepID=A0AA38TM91_9ASTR|nr:hypothetical protein OSB04_008634 [Centaurea solstitialis]
MQTVDMSKERIKKVLSNVELSVSSYDTAWVAMVPSPNSPNSPCFPKCLNWVMDNQLHDGSWGLLHHHHPPLLKDSLSSTLASILALKRWNLGEHQINKGLCFIESNFASATDKNQPSPIGFDIIFAGMLEYAKDLNIRLPLNQTDLSVMLHHRELELRRCCSREKEAYLAYISEGLGNYHDWNIVKKYQMNNGSLFNSPSATAAALIHHQNAACLDYLTSLVNKFGNAVPTVYPYNLYVRLHVVDTLERLGIAQHFRTEIQNVLNETYRYWMQRDEQIFMDVITCALAFRLLRTNGYEVSSDLLTEITKRGDYMNSLEEPSKDIYAALALHQASQIMHQEELISLEEQNSSSTDFLRQKSSTSSIRSNWLNKFIHKQVDIALKFPFNGSLERISTRRNIEHYDVEDARILKTTYRYSNISNKDYLRLAVEDYNTCQSVYREELEGLERWVVENRLDKLKFARQKTAYCYFSAASTLCSPELSDARISWAKNAILGAVIDDFFDVGGSMDEWLNLIQSVEKWNINVDDDCCSEDVRIIFLALKDVVDWVGDKALKRQGRNITSHLIEIVLDMLKSMLREAIWTKYDEVPTINEYMENGYVSFGLGPIVLPVLYLVGPRLSEEIVRSSEYHNLFKLMSTEGRLLNDIQGYKVDICFSTFKDDKNVTTKSKSKWLVPKMQRELEAGKLNAVTLHMRHAKFGLMEENVVKEIKILINIQSKELMKLVLQTKGSIVPKSCKDMFWNMSNVCNFFYATDDGFSGNDILDIVKEIIYEPISHKLTL